MTFDEWWKQMKPAEVDELKEYFEECWQVAQVSALQTAAESMGNTKSRVVLDDMLEELEKSK